MNHDHPHSDHSHGHDGHSHGGLHVHGGGDKKRVLLAGCLTLAFMVVEVAGGLFTGSLALLADAGHMLTDSVSLGLSWYAFHLAERPATGRLTYGFDRVKTLVAYTNGLGIFVIAGWIIYEAIERLVAPPAVMGGVMMLVAVAGLVVNVAGFLILRGGDHASLNMRGAILHVLGDLLGSAAAIVAALVILATGWMPIDPILSVFVAVLILSTAWSLVRDAGHVLLEGTPESMDRDHIVADMTGHFAEVREIHHMHVWSLDGSRNVATLHACLRQGADVHRVVVAMKRRLADKHGIGHATIETEFGECTDLSAHKDEAAQVKYLH
ncbi:MAG: cation diffusion facilitator family transporter [Rhizobiaceae bacterium]